MASHADDARRPARRSLAAFVLAALISGPLVLPHAELGGDPACEPQRTAVDGRGARIGSAGAPADSHHAEHCVLCHWVRAFAPFPTAGGVIDQVALAVSRVGPPPDVAAADLASAPIPSRGPPA